MGDQQHIVSIIRVERDEKQTGCYLVYFNQAAPLHVHEEVMIKYGLLKGTKLSMNLVDEICRADEESRAYVQSITYLRTKPRTRMELTRNLAQKGYEEGIIQHVLDRLQRAALIDDQAYAHQWASQRIALHRKGRRWIQHELRQKGIHEQHICSATHAIDADQEWEGALQAAYKKWRQTEGEFHIRKQKVAAFLVRRGYSLDMARQVAYQVADEWKVNNEDETASE